VATQASAFRADSRFVPRLDRAVLAALMTEDFVPDGGSLFAGVLGLPRGFHLEIRAPDLQVKAACGTPTTATSAAAG